MSAAMDTRPLLELQRDFQRHVMHGHERIIDAVDGTERVPSTLRLSIYSEAYRLRLTDALASSLPRLRQLIGEDEFAALAGEYIDLNPSNQPSIRWFGDRLPLLLRRSFPEAPWLEELACWEWAIAAAFDGADAAPIGADALAAVPPDDWPALRFRFHPSVQCLHMRTNAPVLFKALTAETELPEAVTLEELQPWLIWREQLTTRYRSLTAEENAALEVARSDGTFEALCEALCGWHDVRAVPAQAASLLKRWVADQMIVGVC